MFFKSKNPEPVKEDSRIQDLKIITQMNQDLATTLDLNETLQNALEVIIKRINGSAHWMVYDQFRSGATAIGESMWPYLSFNTNETNWVA